VVNELKEKFVSFDLNGDGDITPEELAHGLLKLYAGNK